MSFILFFITVFKLYSETQSQVLKPLSKYCFSYIMEMTIGFHVQSGTCSLREAVIIGSVIQKASIPPLHSRYYFKMMQK